MGSKVITLFRGSRPVAEYVWSPFADKLEARFRLSGLKYKLDAGTPKNGPRGKIPYIAIPSLSDGGSPELMSDTNLIISHFIKTGLLEDWNAQLTPIEKAQDMAYRALLEEKLYWFGGYEKWYENYYVMRDHSLAALPFPVRFLVGNLAYRSSVSALNGQGTFRFTTEEIQSFRIEIWDTIETLLKDSFERTKPGKKACFWALGKSEPTELDATLYGWIVSSLVCTAAPKSQKIVRKLPTIMSYARRIHDLYYPDFDLWQD